ncbi:MAG: helix-turn-helix domain-containing protein [Saprospiraceae bacterium]|nr:helix-turn-helix domain-containing protein [Saprospiraceae bacterium]
MHKIGEQIRAARIEKGISQEELANAIEMTQSSLSLIEDGLATPVQEKLVAIETYLGVRFEYKEE